MLRDLSDIEGGDRHVVYLLHDIACVKKALPRSLRSRAAGAEAQKGEWRAIRQNNADASVWHGLPVLITPSLLHWSLNPEQKNTSINIGHSDHHPLFPFDVV
jgi:hypothetical protein